MTVTKSSSNRPSGPKSTASDVSKSTTPNAVSSSAATKNKKKRKRTPTPSSSSSDEPSSAEEGTKSKNSKEIALEIKKAQAESQRLNQMFDQAKKAEAKNAEESKKAKSSKKKLKGKLPKTPSMCPTDSDSTSRSRSRTPSGVKTPGFDLEFNAPKKKLK